jgi:hypothetical protein
MINDLFRIKRSGLINRVKILLLNKAFRINDKIILVLRNYLIFLI